MEIERLGFGFENPGPGPACDPYALHPYADASHLYLDKAGHNHDEDR